MTENQPGYRCMNCMLFHDFDYACAKAVAASYEFGYEQAQDGRPEVHSLDDERPDWVAYHEGHRDGTADKELA